MIIEEGTSCKQFIFNEYELQQHDAEVRKPFEDEIKRLNLNWNKLCNYLGDVLSFEDCENGCFSEFLHKVNQIKQYDGSLDLEIREKDKRIKELENELAELKAKLENAIIPI